jgi:hypothetical protein
MGKPGIYIYIYVYMPPFFPGLICPPQSSIKLWDCMVLAMFEQNLDILEEEQG